VDCLIDDVGTDRARGVLREVAEREGIDLYAAQGDE
jgi:hypothetical protein